MAGERPMRRVAYRPSGLHLSLFRHLKGIIDVNAEVSHRALKLRMPKEQLHCPEILGPAINQGSLGATHRVGSIARRIQSDLADPTAHNPRVLTASTSEGKRAGDWEKDNPPITGWRCEC
jgi:hypothetical protein